MNESKEIVKTLKEKGLIYFPKINCKDCEEIEFAGGMIHPQGCSMGRICILRSEDNGK